MTQELLFMILYKLMLNVKSEIQASCQSFFIVYSHFQLDLLKIFNMQTKFFT